MTFGQAIKTCFSKTFVFQGRARRSEFWWYYLFMFIIGTVVGLILMMVFIAVLVPIIRSADPVTGQLPDDQVEAFVWASVLFYGAVIVASTVFLVLMLGAMARRLHDTGQSGHWLWFYLAGLGIVPLIMCIMEGQPHENQYGPDPKAIPVA